MDITFAFHPISTKWNHGIALLSALCKERGISTGLVILGENAGAFDAALASDTPVMGFSAVCHADLDLCLPFMKKAKEAGKIVLLGGTWAGLRHPTPVWVDLVCRGEGEKLPDWLLSGDMAVFGKPQFVTDLNLLPLPDYELFSGIPFERPSPYLEGLNILPYVSSRGCFHKCKFCQARMQPRYRVRTKVAEDLVPLVAKYKPDIVNICDAQLPYHDTQWRESWEDFRFPFVSYIRADIDPELLEWLIDRGMTGCAFGVESGDEKHRNEVLGKGLSDEQLDTTLGILRANDVNYTSFFMSHTPGETWLTQTRTIKRIRSIGGHVMVWEYDPLNC